LLFGHYNYLIYQAIQVYSLYFRFCISGPTLCV